MYKDGKLVANFDGYKNKLTDMLYQILKSSGLTIKKVSESEYKEEIEKADRHELNSLFKDYSSLS